MAVNLFGNIDGRSYTPPTIDLFETARRQSAELDTICETEFGKSNPPVKLEISREGLRALHGSKLKGSMDINEMTEEIKYISRHQPIESFTNRFSRVMPDTYLQLKNSGTAVAEEKGLVLMNSFRDICDEIVSGYAEGNRIRYKEDDTVENGFVRISREEELSILFNEFSAFVENRFGKQHQENALRVAEQTNHIQKTNQRFGIGTSQFFEPLQIPANFVEELLANAKSYIASNTF